jgi:hypothetical protein
VLCEAKTIHWLLEVELTGLQRGEDNPLDCDCWRVQALLQAIPDKAALFIVGEIDELPWMVGAEFWQPHLLRTGAEHKPAVQL